SRFPGVVDAGLRECPLDGALDDAAQRAGEAVLILLLILEVLHRPLGSVAKLIHDLAEYAIRQNVSQFAERPSATIAITRAAIARAASARPSTTRAASVSVMPSSANSAGGVR